MMMITPDIGHGTSLLCTGGVGMCARLGCFADGGR